MQARTLKNATALVRLYKRHQPATLGLTDFDSVPSEPESRKHHLSQSKACSEGGEVADRNDSDKVEEQNRENGVNKPEEKELLSKESDSEGGDNHVG